MPNGIPFSQMTTQYTRQLSEATEPLNEASEMWNDIIRLRLLESENKKLQEENAELTTEKQKAMEPWLGDDWEETTLADWADDIEKQKAEITDDSQREIEALKEEIEELEDFARTMWETMVCCPYTGGEKKDWDYYVGR